MSDADFVAFLQGSAKTLSAAGIADRPFGILVKTSGSYPTAIPATSSVRKRTCAESGTCWLGFRKPCQLGIADPGPTVRVCEIQ